MQSTEVIEVIVPEPPMGCSLALSDRGALCTVEAVQPASRAAGAGVREGVGATSAPTSSTTPDDAKPDGEKEPLRSMW